MSVFYVYLPVLVSAYLLTGLMALQPVFSIAGTMAILPQLGIGMAAVLLCGRHLLWGVFIGELLLQLLANHPLWTLPWYAAGQTAAVVAQRGEHREDLSVQRQYSPSPQTPRQLLPTPTMNSCPSYSLTPKTTD